MEFLYPLADIFPRDADADGGQKRGEDYQPQADTVEADMIADCRRIHPRRIHLEYIARWSSEPERLDEPEREYKDDEGDDQSKESDRSRVLLGEKQRQQKRDERKEDHDGQKIHRVPPAMPIATSNMIDPKTTHAA